MMMLGTGPSIVELGVIPGPLRLLLIYILFILGIYIWCVICRFQVWGVWLLVRGLCLLSEPECQLWELVRFRDFFHRSCSLWTPSLGNSIGYFDDKMVMERYLFFFP